MMMAAPIISLSFLPLSALPVFMMDDGLMIVFRCIPHLMMPNRSRLCDARQRQLDSNIISVATREALRCGGAGSPPAWGGLMHGMSACRGRFQLLSLGADESSFR